MIGWLQEGAPAEVHTEEAFKFLALPELWVVFFVILPLVGAFAWWCYAALSRLERPTRIILASLRGLAVIVVLLMLFQPVLERTRYAKVQSQIHILVDDSASMGRRDTFADNEEARRALSDASGVSDVSRYDRAALAARVLEREDGLLAKLGEDYEISLYRFDRRPLPMESMSELTRRGPRTHIGDALELHLAGSRAVNLDAIILVSDGRSNTGVDPLDAAAKYRLQDVPIHTIGVGDPAPPRNAWIVGPTGPKEALAEEDVAFDVTLRAEGLAGQSVTVTLRGSRNGGGYEALASESAILGDDGDPIPVRLNHAFEQEGDWTLRFEVEELAQESSHDDNTDVRFLRVNDEKIRVLFVDHLPRWEYRYVKNALKRVDKAIEVQVYLTDASPIFTQEHSEALPPLKQLPMTREELFEYHVILLGDVPPESIAPTEEGINQWLQLLREFTEFGGGVGFIFGEEAMPERYRGTPITELLPVVLEDPRALQREPKDWSQEFRVTLDNSARPHESLMLLRDPTENRLLWERGFAPFTAWHRVLRAKPGASVLLRHPTAKNRYGYRVVSAVRPYPRGRTFWQGTDESFRMRHPYGEKHHDTYWRNIVRWLAGGRLARRDDHVELTTDKVVMETGDRVRVNLTVHDDEFHPTIGSEHVVFLRRADQEPQRRTLRAVIGEPGSFQGGFTMEEPGALSVLVFAGDNPSDRVLARQDLLVRTPDKELARANQDVEALRSIAATAGGSEDTAGRYLPLAEADQLKDIFQGRRQMDTPLETSTRPLWDNGWSLLVLLVVLGLEWILRKRARLV